MIVNLYKVKYNLYKQIKICFKIYYYNNKKLKSKNNNIRELKVILEIT